MAGCVQIETIVESCFIQCKSEAAMGSAELRTELENLLKSLNIDFVSVEHPEVIHLKL